MKLISSATIFLLFGTIAVIKGSALPEDLGVQASTKYSGNGNRNPVQCGSGGLYCQAEEICEYVRPPQCDYPPAPAPPVEEHLSLAPPKKGNVTAWDGNRGCPPIHVCNKCCPETCDSMNCCNGYCVYQEIKECFAPPCCPVAKCITYEESPYTTCANVMCPANSRCRLLQKANCDDPKTCIYATCSIYACDGAKFCMY